MTTNIDRIIEALRQWPGLDDDALERQAGVRPRQQVNQICRRLEQRGIVQRLVTANGKIGNFLVGNRAKTGATATTFRPETPASLTPPKSLLVSRTGYSHGFDLASDPSSTLFIICCSSAKESLPGARGTRPSLLDALSPTLARRFKDARGSMRNRAHVDETTFVPAWQRYGGTLYRVAARVLSDVQDRGLEVLIVSGGYGLVLASEPIGIYDAIFHLSSWPKGLLEEVLIDYAQRRKLKCVRAITSATGDYRKLLTRTNWAAAGIEDAILLSPQAGPGAMVLSPRAQGEALTALITGTMDANWLSSDGLQLDFHRLA